MGVPSARIIWTSTSPGSRPCSRTWRRCSSSWTLPRSSSESNIETEVISSGPTPYIAAIAGFV